jgi:prephenate dehydrogenase
MPASASLTTGSLTDHVVVVGVGLIGGSIARALKARGLAGKITGLGRSRERLLAAQEAGLLDAVATSPSALEPFSLAIVCTPVDRIPDDVRDLLDVAPASAVITDAGSVKARICREFASHRPGQAVFLGSHPMAGSEQGGWEHSSAQLFEGRICAVTPTGHAEPVVQLIERFWSALGMGTIRLDPDQHDRIVALTSHLPHATAAAVAQLLTPEAWPLAATGFRDTTRVASGDPALWTSILIENRDAISGHLSQLIRVLHSFAVALDQRDTTAIEALLSQGKTAREEWLRAQREGVPQR